MKITDVVKKWLLTSHNWVKYWPTGPKQMYCQSRMVLVESNPVFFLSCATHSFETTSMPSPSPPPFGESGEIRITGED